ncbi:hypothetical protein CK203_044041 [Vitis vinifera]|uniref:RNase H type-1 domain-containing protein n=1 Tax=Vitis vinifera TaxID=29760 RepID=A0A438HM45_VITVI|nr:hypothetical protein CK203_044041 [Vitis vinifera]
MPLFSRVNERVNRECEVHARCRRKRKGVPITMPGKIRDLIRASTGEGFGQVPKNSGIRASTENGGIRASTETVKFGRVPEKGPGRVPEKVPGKYRRRVQASTEKAPGEYRKVTPISDSTELIDFWGIQISPGRLGLALLYLLMRGVKEEIQKQLSVGFLSVVEYPGGWLMSSLFPKRTARLEFGVDFRDLNKASPKDDFPLPHIDMLVDSTGRASRCYPSWMVFLGATYQRAATTLFHDMMHRDIEFRLRLNPKKCTFGVTSGKLLGHIVSERGRLQYISCFIARLTDICEPIFHLLRKNQPTVWNDDCQRAFERIKGVSPFSSVLVLPHRGVLCFVPISFRHGLRMHWFWATRRLRHYMTEYYVLLVSRLEPVEGDHIPRSVRLAFSNHHRLTNNIVEYEACITGLETALDLGIRQLEIHGDSNLVIKQTQGPLLIETRSAPAYCCLIGEIEDQIELPWCHDIYQFMSCDAYPERSPDGLLLLCLDRASADRVMREVHAGVCGPHMGGHMLARVSDAWRLDTCATFLSCMHLHPLAIFQYGVLILLGRSRPSLPVGMSTFWLPIDYFTKWVEAASYARQRGAFQGRGGHVDSRVWHSASQIVCIQAATNGAVEAQIRISRGFEKDGRDFSGLVREAPFRIVGLSYIFRTSIGATPYSLVYGMEAVLPIEIEMRSLRVALEQHISEAEWAQSRYDQLSLLDEKRLRAADHVQTYQRKMTMHSKRGSSLGNSQRGDLVLKVLRGLDQRP